MMRLKRLLRGVGVVSGLLCVSEAASQYVVAPDQECIRRNSGPGYALCARGMSPGCVQWLQQQCPPTALFNLSPYFNGVANTTAGLSEANTRQDGQLTSFERLLNDYSKRVEALEREVEALKTRPK
jgi:hypothetical protein